MPDKAAAKFWKLEAEKRVKRSRCLLVEPLRSAKKWIQEINLGATATWFLPELLNAEPAMLLMPDVRVGTFHMSRS